MGALGFGNCIEPMGFIMPCWLAVGLQVSGTVSSHWASSMRCCLAVGLLAGVLGSKGAIGLSFGG